MKNEDFLHLEETQNLIMMWGEAAQRFGFSRVAGQIMVALYVAGEPLGADELSSITRFARSTLAPAIKELEGIGFIKSVRHIGERKELLKLQFGRPVEIYLAYENAQRHRYIQGLPRASEELLKVVKRTGDKELEARIAEVTEWVDIIADFYTFLGGLKANEALKFLKDAIKKGRSTKR